MNQEKDVPSDPYAELSFRSDEQAGRTVELHLGQRGITRLTDFHAFLSLDTLWLNDNKLKSLAGLENNFRIRHLYAHNNRIKRLKGSVMGFKFLVQISLYGNLLDNLEGTLEELSNNKYLEQLELFDNPIAQEDNYRLLVIINIPWLIKLDRLKITDEEREEAAILKAKMDSLKDFKFGTRKRPPTDEELALRAQKEATCQRGILSLRDHIKAKRIFLEPYFLPFDPKGLGLVDVYVFQETLQSLDLARILDEGEEDALIEKYSAKMPTAVRDLDLRKTIPTRKALDYKKFCSDLLPAGLRVLEDKWKPAFNGEMSSTTIALEGFVKTVRARLEAEAEAARKNALLSRGGKEEKVFSTDRKPYTCEEHGLSAWQNSTMSKYIKKMTKDGPETQLDKNQIKEILSYFEIQGIFPTCGTKQARLQLLEAGQSSSGADSTASPGSNGTVSLAIVCAAFGVEGVVAYNAMKTAQDDPNCPFFNWITPEYNQRENLASREFGDASISLQQLLRLGPADDTTEQANLTMTLGTNGTRMLADRTKPKKKSPFESPTVVMKKMAKRADAIVLPSLKGAEAKKIKEGEIMKDYDFSNHFAKLGLKGDALEIALTRKRRSILGGIAESEKAAAIAAEEAKKPKKPLNEGEVPEKKLKSFVAEFLNAPMYKQGWSAATGTITLSDHKH